MLSPLRAQSDTPARDTLLVTPTTQGIFRLPQTGVTLEIGYASVREPSHLTVTRQDTPSNPRYTFAATDPYGVPLARFEMPLIAHLPPGEGPFPVTARPVGFAALPATRAAHARDPVTALIGWPVQIAVLPESVPPDEGRWLVIFDANGIYAQPAWEALPDSIIYLGPLEHYTPALIRHDPALEALGYADRPSPAATARYRERFLPEVRSNPGAFRALGWAEGSSLPGVARALQATIPPDPDLPAPGVPEASIALILPFDCSQTWVISWGYHHSTPQNRFAVDFAADTPNGSQGQPVYAAHAGMLSLKRYGTPDHPIDVGLGARVMAADGITSTLYGHLDPPGTFALWKLDPGVLPDYEWVAIGEVAQGQIIGAVGRTGYATGAHIHFALWSWDQSLYQPVPFGPLTDFPRGLRIPGDRRADCDRYRRR